MIIRKCAVRIYTVLDFAFIVANMLNFNILFQQEVRFTLIREFLRRYILNFLVVHLDVEIKSFHPDELVFYLALFGFLNNNLFGSLPSHRGLIHNVYQWLFVYGVDFWISTDDDGVLLDDVINIDVPLKRLLDCYVHAVKLISKILITFVIDPRLGREEYSCSPLVPWILQRGVNILVLGTPGIFDFTGGLCQQFPFLDDAELFRHLPI